MRQRFLAVGLLAIALCGSPVHADVRPLLPSAGAQLAETVAALTTPEMEGRRSGTPGGDRAAALIADWLRAAGLHPAGDRGTFFQTFSLSTGTRLAAGNVLELPDGAAPGVGVDWLPHGGSASGEVEAEVVFVGHGISTPEQGYDDYRGVDVRGRIALALGGAPAHFGRRVTRVEKVVAARGHGARALLVIEDALPALDRTPVAAPLVSASVRRAAAARLLPPGRSVDDVEAAPFSVATGRRARVRVALEAARVTATNVVAMLPGNDPALRDETVVVGAHYDHLGLVGNAVHHGADDNASGTAVVVALARAFAAAGGAPRTLVFALFGAEELGLIGSAHYVAHPSRTLDRTVGMVNFDMVGRLRDGRLTVGGVDSAAGLQDAVAGLAAAASVRAETSGSPFGPSDHTSFYRAGVPVLFFHTGAHADYHRPSDTADKLDVDGMARVTDLGGRVVQRLASAPRPVYARVTAPAMGRARREAGAAFLGVRGQESDDGARLLGVVPGSAADRAGLREGDVVIRIDGAPLATFDELRAAVRARHAGDRVQVVFVRNGESRAVSAVLESTP